VNDEPRPSVNATAYRACSFITVLLIVTGRFRECRRGLSVQQLELLKANMCGRTVACGSVTQHLRHGQS
jgi:hypothetical protein